ncbi:hypothetical protein RUM44_010482 [Polyplax serrata]|uniref:C2H2-type domain-containing protein n=1 Tax=Polyplax serrata TaxID=468196 RepID=A0ABR1AVN1_POLSC
MNQSQGFISSNLRVINIVDDIDQSLKNVNMNVSKDLVAAAGFNVETPIVSAIIGNITGILPTKKNVVTEAQKKGETLAPLCPASLTNDKTKILNSGILQLKALNIIAQLKEEKGIHVDKTDMLKTFHCDICSLTVNSAQQLEFHLSGAKHKKKIAKANFLESVNYGCNDIIGVQEPALLPKKSRKEEPKTVTCKTCNVVMNSQNQYDQHLGSKKHKLRSTKVGLRRRYWNAYNRP